MRILYNTPVLTRNSYIFQFTNLRCIKHTCLLTITVIYTQQFPLCRGDSNIRWKVFNQEDAHTHLYVYAWIWYYVHIYEHYVPHRCWSVIHKIPNNRQESMLWHIYTLRLFGRFLATAWHLKQSECQCLLENCLEAHVTEPHAYEVSHI